MLKIDKKIVREKTKSRKCKQKCKKKVSVNYTCNGFSDWKQKN